MGDTPTRPPEGAAFEAARVGSRRGVSPLIVAVWVLGLGAVVAFGLSGRVGPPNAVGAAPTERPSQRGQAIPSEPAVAVASPRRPAVTAPGDGPVRLEVVRSSASLFVHGDVHAEDVVWVFLSILTDDGRVAGWASLSFPGAVDEEGDTPALRFDVELVIPADMQSGRLWAHTTVYDALGRRVGTMTMEVPAGLVPEASPTLAPAALRGFRPGAHFPHLDATWEDEP